MKRKGTFLRGLVLDIVIFLTISLTVVYADDNPSVRQVYITEQTMTVFTDTELASDSLTCMVSNQETEIITVGALSGEDTLVRTTVLIDISGSIPSVVRNEVIGTLKKLIEIKPVNEEIKLVTFGNELVVIQDFTADRYDLSVAIDKIVFDGSQTKIYDAVYNTIPDIVPIENKPTFYRTIIITDGVDETASGVTKEELFLKLQNKKYPVDAVDVDKEVVEENKELAAIVRISGGEYHSLMPEVDITALAEALGKRKESYFSVKLPDDLLDGTTRQVDISSGAHSLSIDVKIPVFGSPVQKVQEEAPIVETPPPTQISEPIQEEVSDLEDEPKINLMIVSGVVLFIFMTVVIILLKKNSKKTSNLEEEILINPDNDGEETEMISDTSAGINFTIKLTNPNDRDKTWILPIVGELLIGRSSHCSVKLNDKSVARDQCKIIIRDRNVYIVNLSSTNKTILNGNNVLESALLQSGDTLKLGREKLYVDYIQIDNSHPRTNSNYDIQKTESLF